MKGDLNVRAASLNHDFIKILSIISGPLNLKSVFELVANHLGIKRLPLQILDLEEFTRNLGPDEFLNRALFLRSVNLGP